MKIIDKTPLQNPQGQLDFMGRVQGMLRFGFGWPRELEAQKLVIAQLDRVLEKGFVLIHNFLLPEIEVLIPMILLGPGGIYVVHVTNAKGQFEAKGDQWNTVSYGRGLPARVNLLENAFKHARALERYLKQQNIQLLAPLEPVLIAANPGAHVDSMRPIVRVVMSDAIKQFAGSLLQARPIWRTDNVHEVADRIVTPRPPVVPEAQASQGVSASEPPATPQRTPSRAAAIFEAAETAQPFNPADLDFAFDEGQGPVAPQAIPQNLRETSPAQPLPRPAPKKGKVLGMTGGQLALLIGLFVVECCVVVIGLGVFFYLNR